MSLVFATLLLTGCSQILINFPPVPMSGTDAVPVASGDGSIQVGLGAMSLPGLPFLSDYAGGGLNGGLGFGLSDKVDLGFDAGIKLFGPNFGVRAGHTLLNTEPHTLGLTGGLGFSYNHGEWDVTTYDIDADDEDEGETTHIDYTYASIVPWAGVRYRYQLGPKVSIPVLARFGGSALIPIRNVTEDYKPVAWFGEAQSGLLFGAKKVFFAVDLGMRFHESEEDVAYFYPRYGLNFRVDL